MFSTFDRSGIRFQYPTNWTLDLDDNDGDWTATVQSPDLAFFLVSLTSIADTPAALADETFDALREEYKELEATNVVASFLGRPAIGHDIEFLTLDASISCRTRCVDTPNGPMLILWQVSDYDREKNEPVLNAICQSLNIEDE